jgi:hypothetical protein
MARRAIDSLSQSILVHELRRAIDVARNSDEGTKTWELAVGRVMQLCRENPRSTLRSHVLHNLGCGRRHWLRQLSAKIRQTSTALSIHLDLMGKCDRRGVTMAAESPVT